MRNGEVTFKLDGSLKYWYVEHEKLISKFRLRDGEWLIWQIKPCEHTLRGACTGSCQAGWEKTSSRSCGCLQGFPKGTRQLGGWRWSPHSPACASLSPWADLGSDLEIVGCPCVCFPHAHSYVCMAGCHDQMHGIALERRFPLLCTDMPSATAFGAIYTDWNKEWGKQSWHWWLLKKLFFFLARKEKVF